MINDESLRAVEQARRQGTLVRPIYDSYCFAQLPGLVESLFVGDQPHPLHTSLLGDASTRYDAVILFFVDAFGWRFFDRWCDGDPFLQRIVRDGTVSKLTAQFPSTTAAHTTTLHTGLPVGQSGVYEWYYYEPLVDAIIAPLLFSFAGDHARNTLQEAHVDPAALYPRQTIYGRLQQYGVRSFVFQHQGYTPSPYSDVVFGGARVVPYATLSEALVALANLVLDQKERTYYVLYFDKIDAIGHRHGPSSPHFAAEVDTFLSVMERQFYRSLAGRRPRTLFLMTADHGQVDVDPATTIYLNRRLPAFTRFLKTNRAGRLLVPAGSCRDMFLHVKEEYLDAAHAYLHDRLADHAAVYRVAELIDQHFFGPGEPSPAFLGRVGDLVILPHEHQTVWWYEQGRFEQPYRGHHGGLTRDEMETILLALPEL